MSKNFFAKQIKCTAIKEKGKCGSIATKGSISNGKPLCWRCDPDHVRPVKNPKVDYIIKERPESVLTKETGRGDVMPATLAETYSVVVADPQLVALKEDIATYEAQIRAKLRTQKEGKTIPGEVMELSRKIDVIKSDVASGATPPQNAILQIDAIVKKITEGKVSESDTWDDIHKLTAEKRRLVTAETARMRSIGWTPDHIDSLVVEMCSIIQTLYDENKLTTGALMKQLGRSELFNNEHLRIAPSGKFHEFNLEDRIESLGAFETTEVVDGEFEVASVTLDKEKNESN